MSAPIIMDGKTLSINIQNQLKERVENIKQKSGITPILATVLVGNDPASDSYVNMKCNACKRVGMESKKVQLPETTTTEEFIEVIDQLNSDDHICGIMLQHPFPAQIDERACFNRIAIEKDVDGVTALGFGMMALNETAYGSATPVGILKMLEYYNIPLEGKHAVVIGRGVIMGKPIGYMFLNENATITICHSKTQNLPEIVKMADIIVGAVGKPKFVKADWIKEGAVVIDAGFHPGGIGDVEIDEVKDKSYAYTPVPGGVGPMTIATLVAQTVEAAEKKFIK